MCLIRRPLVFTNGCRKLASDQLPILFGGAGPRGRPPPKVPQVFPRESGAMIGRLPEVTRDPRKSALREALKELRVNLTTTRRGEALRIRLNR